MSNMSVHSRRAALEPLTEICISLHVNKTTPSGVSTPIEFAENELKKCLNYTHYPEIVLTSGRCILKIAEVCGTPSVNSHDSTVEQLLRKPYYQAFGIPPYLLWETVRAFIILLSCGDMGPGTSREIVGEVAEVLPMLPPHLQWSTVIQFLDLLPVVPPTEANKKTRLLILVTGLDRVLKLSLANITEALEEKKELKDSLYKELVGLGSHAMWKLPKCQEEAVYAATMVVMHVKKSLAVDSYAMLAGWCAIGLHVVKICLQAFGWQDEACPVASLHGVLKCMLKIFDEGLSTLRAKKKKVSPQWIVELEKAHAQNTFALASMLVNNDVGKVCRTVTKVGLLCTAAALLPKVEMLPEGFSTRGIELEKGIMCKLSHGCAKYMVDERETLSLALFHALIFFGATRGGECWVQCDAAVESVMRDRTKSATAPGVLMSVKRKLDLVRGLMVDGGLPIADLLRCGVMAFSEHHPALHHDLAPADISLHLQCHEILMEIRTSALKLFTRSNLTPLLKGRPPAPPQHTQLITAPTDPLQILATYIWKGTRLDVSLTITNPTLVTLNNVRVTIGSTGDLTPLFKPMETALSANPLGSGLKSTKRSDTVLKLPPSGTAEIVRVFNLASFTQGMGFNTLVDLELGSSEDDGDDFGLNATRVCRLHCDFVPLQLEHLMVEKHPLLAYPAANAVHLIPHLPVSTRLYTVHVRGDVAAIRSRIESEMFDTQFVEVTPTYDFKGFENEDALNAGSNIKLVYMCGLRDASGGAGSGEVITMTISSKVIGRCESTGSTKGYQAAASATQGLGECVLLSWLFQASSQLTSDLIMHHPSFAKFFTKVSDTEELRPPSDDEIVGNVEAPSTEEALSEWTTLRKKYSATLSATRVPPKPHVGTRDPWGDFRAGTVPYTSTSKALFKSQSDASFFASSENLFSARAGPATPPPNLFNAPSESLFGSVPANPSENLFGPPANHDSLFKTDAEPAEDLFGPPVVPAAVQDDAVPDPNSLFGAPSMPEGKKEESDASLFGASALEAQDTGAAFPPPAEDLFGPPSVPAAQGDTADPDSLFGAPSMPEAVNKEQRDSDSSSSEPGEIAPAFPPAEVDSASGPKGDLVTDTNLFGTPLGANDTSTAFPPAAEDLFGAPSVPATQGDVADPDSLFGAPSMPEAARENKEESDSESSSSEPAVARNTQQPSVPDADSSDLFGPSSVPAAQGDVDPNSLFGAPSMPEAAREDGGENDASSSSSEPAEVKDQPGPAHQAPGTEHASQDNEADANLFGAPLGANDTSTAFPPAAEDLFGVPSVPATQGDVADPDSLFGAPSMPEAARENKEESDSESSSSEPAVARNTQQPSVPDSQSSSDPSPKGGLAADANLFGAPLEANEMSTAFPPAAEDLFGAPSVPAAQGDVDPNSLFGAPSMPEAAREGGGEDDASSSSSEPAVFRGAPTFPASEDHESPPNVADANLFGAPALTKDTPEDLFGPSSVPTVQGDIDPNSLFGAPSMPEAREGDASPSSSEPAGAPTFPPAEDQKASVPSNESSPKSADKDLFGAPALGNDAVGDLFGAPTVPAAQGDVDPNSLFGAPSMPEAAREGGGEDDASSSSSEPAVFRGAPTFPASEDHESPPNAADANLFGAPALTKDTPEDLFGPSSVPAAQGDVDPNSLFGAPSMPEAREGDASPSSSEPAGAPTFPPAEDQKASVPSNESSPKSADKDLFGAPALGNDAVGDLFGAPTVPAAQGDVDPNSLFGAPSMPEAAREDDASPSSSEPAGEDQKASVPDAHSSSESSPKSADKDLFGAPALGNDAVGDLFGAPAVIADPDSLFGAPSFSPPSELAPSGGALPHAEDLFGPSSMFEAQPADGTSLFGPPAKKEGAEVDGVTLDDLYNIGATQPANDSAPEGVKPNDGSPSDDSDGPMFPGVD
eukprot:TRINITY_DN604_c0_g1_i8.p1 TRINITY_DN604_c0_g1~~TRINITY_DN604_c0_g1_i8.p1  ORF type:complete len:2137 (+),score=262.30 TRINITY_DN604_c0_g1_i8:680-6412(+)